MNLSQRCIRKMKQEQINEIHRLRCEWFEKNGFRPQDMLAYLMSEFVGTVAMSNIPEELAKKIFDRMFEQWKRHPNRKENEKSI